MPEDLVSLNPDDYGEGGGGLDDMDGKIIEARAVIFDYDGKFDPSPGALLKVDVGADEPLTQFWSIGSSNDWEPNADGTGFKPIGKRTTIVKTANLGMLITSAINAGFPKDKVKNDLTVFEGLECHFDKVAVERKGLGNKETSTIIITKIHKLPGGKGSTAKKGASKGSTKASAEVSEEVKVKAIACVMRIIEAQGEKYPDGVPKSKLGPLAFQDEELKGDADKGKISTLVYKESFLSGEDVPWTYDPETGLVSLA